MVNRRILYKILKKKQILESKEISLLKYIDSYLMIGVGESLCMTETGVPQGSAISPPVQYLPG
jgi:hypothetical protein